MTRLARLRHSDYEEYWKRGGREDKPNKSAVGDRVGEEHGEQRGEATKLGEEKGKKDEDEGGVDNQKGD